MNILLCSLSAISTQAIFHFGSFQQARPFCTKKTAVQKNRSVELLTCYHLLAGYLSISGATYVKMLAAKLRTVNVQNPSGTIKKSLSTVP
jgi:hypothetical protein